MLKFEFIGFICIVQHFFNKMRDVKFGTVGLELLTKMAPIVLILQKRKERT